MKRWPKDDAADARILAERVADELTSVTCPWCGKPAPGWAETYRPYANGRMPRSRAMRPGPGPGIEYHCMEAVD